MADRRAQEIRERHERPADLSFEGAKQRAVDTGYLLDRVAGHTDHRMSHDPRHPARLGATRLVSALALARAVVVLAWHGPGGGRKSLTFHPHRPHYAYARRVVSEAKGGGFFHAPRKLFRPSRLGSGPLHRVHRRATEPGRPLFFAPAYRIHDTPI